MKIFATGDTHWNFERFRPEYFPEGQELTKKDVVLQLGDFVGVWFGDKRDDEALDTLLQTELPEAELYLEIGRAICARPEKGAAVMAAEYLQANYPECGGFSPRNLRRMREFYRAYADSRGLRALALKLGWTQNVAILEGCEGSQERTWYLRAALEHRWTKSGLGHGCNPHSTNRRIPAILKKIQRVWSVWSMKKILFVCHGNICRSPMAEYVMKDLVKKAGLEAEFQIASAATSREEIGNPVYPPARRKLAEHGISCEGHAARQLRNRDYEEYDLLIGMDKANLHNMFRICGGDFNNKMHLLLEYAGRPDQEVADPWYTGDFDSTWQDVLEGCEGLLDNLM